MPSGQLANPALIDTPRKRQQLSYLVRCALPAGERLQATINGASYTFTGAIGLAPAWTGRALNGTEQRWVSACMLAHVNHFGKHIQISLRAHHTAPVPFLRATPLERARYSIYEGGFFGNLFVRERLAFACEGRRTAKQQLNAVLRDRVCTQALPVAGRATSVSACGFIVTGACAQPTALVGRGRAYREVIDVYLQPRPS